MGETSYLLDASVLIKAKELYYPTQLIPEYWRWIRKSRHTLDNVTHFALHS
jgi:hypothetical protein